MLIFSLQVSHAIFLEEMRPIANEVADHWQQLDKADVINHREWYCLCINFDVVVHEGERYVRNDQSCDEGDCEPEIR